MKKDKESHRKEKTDTDSRKTIIEAAAMFSRLSPDVQDSIIALVKSLLSENKWYRMSSNARRWSSLIVFGLSIPIKPFSSHCKRRERFHQFLYQMIYPVARDKHRTN